jgi:hypothetical protein
MGNQSSKPNIQENKNTINSMSEPAQIIDYIATHYILTMDFQSLKKLYDKDYCDKLVILTSNIVEQYFNDLQLKYIEKRIVDGEETNIENKEDILFYNKDKETNFDVQNPSNKKAICLNISKFYIKIAHLFATIVTTINPIFVYKDNKGSIKRANLYQKMLIPKNATIEVIQLNMCDNRINALKGDINYTESESANQDTIKVAPKVCDMNLNDAGETKNLSEEPGIPELYELYLDDNYDFETGKFTSMTENTKQQFLNDLKNFYKVFTGKDDMPDNITNFNSIKLRDYHNTNECKGDDPVFERVETGSNSDPLFSQYAENLKEMINKVNKGQEALLQVLDKIFVYVTDEQTNKKQIRINPQLNEDLLQQLIVETRSLIVSLYLTCEVDYANGIKIYEAIIEKKILETAQSQIANLEKLSENLTLD